MRTRLKVLRIQKGLTQKEAAERLGVTTASYSYVESGKRFGGDKIWKGIKALYGIKDKDIWGIQHEE